MEIDERRDAMTGKDPDETIVGGSFPGGDRELRGATQLGPGTLLNKRYLVEKELGRGGIGVVYLAHDRQLLSRPVVVKILLDESAENEWFKKKFRLEIEALARINHPGVVEILDAGELADGKPYIVMQFIEGVSLRSLIRVEGMSLDRTGQIIRQIGQALSAAHDRGVYHRDLKPENVMLQRVDQGEDLVRVIDFGIATVKDSQLASDKSRTSVAGTIAYMAPEQLLGKPSASSDIYSLGVIAYEMVTGRRPFNPDSPYQLLEMQRAGVRVMPIDLRPSLPEAAQRTIMRALSFEPEDRYKKAKEFGEQLLRAMDSASQRVSLSENKTAIAEPKLGERVEGRTLDKARAALAPVDSRAAKIRPYRTRYLLFGVLLAGLVFAAIFYLKPAAKPDLTKVDFFDDFPGAMFDQSRWSMPSAGWRVETDRQLHIENAQVICYPKDLIYADFVMRFHLTLADAKGAAWAVRVQDSDNYYLFYLKGPEGDVSNRFNTYIVHGNKLDPKKYFSSLPMEIVQLTTGGQYDVEITANKNMIEQTITNDDSGKQVTLPPFQDPNNTFPYGSVGFRSVGSEQFSIAELHVIPPGTQPPR